MINDVITKDDFSFLAQMHLILSGIKAFNTWESLEGLKVTRELCGGHGYSAYAGISSLIESSAPNCTLEGDNYVMLQ